MRPGPWSSPWTWIRQWLMVSFASRGRAWFESVTDELMNNAVKILRDNVQEGEEITKHNIENSGTLKSGKRGRVETGEMRDSVSSGIISASDEEVVGRFGWLNGPKWAKFQEHGFVHVSGVPVEGMFALSDAAQEVEDNLRDDLRGVI